MSTIKLFIIFTMALIVSACGDSNSNTRNVKQVSSDPQDALYTCAMHPHYISTDKGGTCPICGMNLVPVKNAEVEHGEPKFISVSADMVQTMGVRTSTVEMVDFSRTLRAFGTVEVNERLENVSVSRIEGWIEQLNISAEGDAVNNGDLLYRVYSPDLLSAQRDYLTALNSSNKQRLESVTQRLRSIGMQDQALAQLRQSRKVIEKVPVYAESDGIVAELSVREGSYIKPGTLILRLQSYRNVWVIASVPETDLSLISNGVSAYLRFPSAPQAPSLGTVDTIYPTIDPKTRTAKVRIEVDNSEGQLLPGAYADISFRFANKPRLSIVSEALLRDSRGGHVIVALGEGRFTSRAVVSGISVGGRTEIISGLAQAELVVASAQFMLDSEVNLREGLSKLSQSDATLSVFKASEQGSVLSEVQVNSESLAQLDHFVDAALYLHEVLTKGIEFNADFLNPAIALSESLIDELNNSAITTLLISSKSALLNAKASSNKQQLKAHLGQLTDAFLPWLLLGAPEHYTSLGLRVYRDKSTTQVWLQSTGNLMNPYGLEKQGDVDIYQWSSRQWRSKVVVSPHLNRSTGANHE